VAAFFISAVKQSLAFVTAAVITSVIEQAQENKDEEQYFTVVPASENSV
jgi:hypothetical protein